MQSSINERLAKMPLILSLYYLNKEDFMSIYEKTNIEGQKILDNFVELLATFKSQTNIETIIEQQM